MSNSKEHRYGIGAVARLTGLSDHTIRVWERRYSAVVAERAANGRRVYGPAEVEKLGLLKTLTDQGLGIGQIAGESVEALRDRIQGLGDIVQARLPDRVTVAVLGEFLQGYLSAHRRDFAPVEFPVIDNNRDSFLADLARQPVDVIAIECPVLDAEAISNLHEILAETNGARGILVYNFGRSSDVARAHDAGIVTLRAPVDVEDLRAAVLRAYAPPAASRARSAEAVQDAEWQVPGPIAPRRFTHHQLSTLAHSSATIDCECPRHLAQLVGDLTAFEIYSAQCANRDDDDAALHRFLHQTTAQARAMIEVALERVAAAEGIEY